VWGGGDAGSAGKRHGMPSGAAHGASRVLQALGFMAAHMLMVEKLGWTLTNNDWFRREPYLRLPLVQRLGCHVAQGAANQIKYYFLWKLAESANSLSGFDFLGYAPDGSARWGRSVNVRLRGMWLSDSATIVPTHWNLRTGIFLKHYVYERLVGGGRPGFAHILVTQLVTAFWHGVYPGYFIFFISTVFYLQSARTIYRAEQTVLPGWLVGSSLWWLIKVVWTDVAVCHLSMAFMLLEANASFEVFRDVGFVIHITMFVLSAVGMALPRASRKKAKEA